MNAFHPSNCYVSVEPGLSKVTYSYWVNGLLKTYTEECDTNGFHTLFTHQATFYEPSQQIIDCPTRGECFIHYMRSTTKLPCTPAEVITYAKHGEEKLQLHAPDCKSSPTDSPPSKILQPAAASEVSKPVKRKKNDAEPASKKKKCDIQVSNEHVFLLDETALEQRIQTVILKMCIKDILDKILTASVKSLIANVKE